MDRRKFNKLWLLFVVFATGLVWTWSQVGQRSSRSPDAVNGEAIELLRVEADCDLSRGPCGAYGGDMALVASVRVDGAGLRWRVKVVGQGAPTLPALTLELRVPGGAPQALTVVRAGDEWQAYSAGRVPKGTVLRARLSGGERPWVADFPLSGG